MFVITDSTSSTSPPIRPLAVPSRTASAVAMAPAVNATSIDVLVPESSSDRTSWPVCVVPSR